MIPVILSAAVAAGMSYFLFSGSDVSEEKIPQIGNELVCANMKTLKQELATTENLKVGILGQLGAGKSTLILKLTDGLVYPRPTVGRKTDATNWAIESPNMIFQSGEHKICYIDAPGFNTELHTSDDFINFFSLESFDLMFYVIRNKRYVSDDVMLNAVKKSGKPFYILYSFCESVETKEEKKEVIDDFRNCGHDNVIFVSNRTKEGIEQVQNIVYEASNTKEKKNAEIRRIIEDLDWDITKLPSRLTNVAK